MHDTACLSTLPYNFLVSLRMHENAFIVFILSRYTVNLHRSTDTVIATFPTH
jgi:hypothetical protein